MKRSRKQQLWLDDHPGQTPADFARVSARAAALGDGWPVLPDDENIVEFGVWEIVQELVADGYLIRVPRRPQFKEREDIPADITDPDLLELLYGQRDRWERDEHGDCVQLTVRHKPSDRGGQ